MISSLKTYRYALIYLLFALSACQSQSKQVGPTFTGSPQECYVILYEQGGRDSYLLRELPESGKDLVIDVCEQVFFDLDFELKTGSSNGRPIHKK